MNSVRFYNCSGCGHDWEVTFKPPKTKEDIIREQRRFDEIFGDHCCHRCTERQVLISLKTNAGKKVNYRELNKHLKKKYGW